MRELNKYLAPEKIYSYYIYNMAACAKREQFYDNVLKKMGFTSRKVCFIIL